jgi:hypothetical protein
MLFSIFFGKLKVYLQLENWTNITSTAIESTDGYLRF